MAVIKRVTGEVREKRPEKIVRGLSIAEFYEKRNKILIIRNVGGLGDIFMHRMIFEDIKLMMPDAEIHFCCPSYYHDAVKDHPYIDKILDYKDIDKNNYIISYNTTTACGRTEMRFAPLSGPHRSDIWANHCGFNLTRHNMHITISDEEKTEANRVIEEQCGQKTPTVAICPVSAMQNKNLLENQLVELTRGLKERKLNYFCLHNNPVNICYRNNIPLIIESRIRIWMAILNQADYVISVDTAAFHCAGGMGKPLVGIYTFADGQVYGKYYDFFIVQKHRNTDPCWTCGPCYNWGNCIKTTNNPKPCLTEITSEMMLSAVDSMLAKFPMNERIAEGVSCLS